MLILASASPRRRELLSRLVYDFVVDAADVDETIASGTAPHAAATALALAKARCVAARRGDGAPVLAADTIVVAEGGGILGKPADASAARSMLRTLSATTQRVITGVCVLLPGRELVDAVTTRVTMRELTDDEIDAYVASGEPFGKAGGYAIQETGDRFVTAVDGSWTNVVGLPLERVRELLTEAGLPVSGAV